MPSKMEATKRDDHDTVTCSVRVAANHVEIARDEKGVAIEGQYDLIVTGRGLTVLEMEVLDSLFPHSQEQIGQLLNVETLIAAVRRR